MKSDLFLNPSFQLGRGVWEQYTRVAIGGPMYAQNAEPYLMAMERTVPWGQFISSHVNLGRFRDNIFYIMSHTRPKCMAWHVQLPKNCCNWPPR